MTVRLRWTRLRWTRVWTTCVLVGLFVIAFVMLR